MKFVCACILFLLLTAFFKVFANYDTNDYTECIDNLLRKSPRLATRFSFNELSAYCYTFESWETGKTGKHVGVWAGKGRPGKPPPNFKDNKWLDHLRRCKGPRCPIDNFHIKPFGKMRAARKEYRMMSAFERSRFHKVLNRLKREVVGRYSKYDILAVYHMPDQCPGAHWGPAFLPFHRELLKELEVAIREMDPWLALPYWDSTLDDRLPDPTHSILWSDGFLGNGRGDVTHGPFAGWIATHEHKPPFRQLGTTPLHRTVGKTVFPGSTAPFGAPYKETDVEFAATRKTFNGFNHCVDPTFEVDHGNVHAFVGGHFFTPAAPNEPAFFMHHAFLDYMWEEFRQKKQTRNQREIEYPSEADSCKKPEYYANAQMKPFNITNIDGLSNSYTDYLYFYEPRPHCSPWHPDCGSDNIFCDTRKYLCVSKIRKGGNCTGFEGMDICEMGWCKPDRKCPGTTKYE